MDTRKQAVLVAVFLQLISLQLVYSEESPGSKQQDDVKIELGGYEVPTSLELAYNEDVDEPKVKDLLDYDDPKYDLSNDEDTEGEYSTGRKERSPGKTQIRVPHDYNRIKRSLNFELEGRDLPRSEIAEIQETDEGYALTREKRSPRKKQIRVPHDYNRIKRSSRASFGKFGYRIDPNRQGYGIDNADKGAMGYTPTGPNGAHFSSGGRNGAPNVHYARAFDGQAAIASSSNFGGYKPPVKSNPGQFYRPVGGNYKKEGFIGYGGTDYAGSNYYGGGAYSGEWNSDGRAQNSGNSQLDFSDNVLQSGGNGQLFLPRNGPYVPSN